MTGALKLDEGRGRAAGATTGAMKLDGGRSRPVVR